MLGSNSTKAARESGRNCLVMKVLSQRSITLDALQKNLRMVWKPNKSMQIPKLEDELYMVKFRVEKDKKKILEMRPWSYDKELIILQEFEGDQMPKEMALKWSPFWIQIHNLPLKSRTRETGYSIGTIIGDRGGCRKDRSAVGEMLKVRVMVDWNGNMSGSGWVF